MSTKLGDLRLAARWAEEKVLRVKSGLTALHATRSRWYAEERVEQARTT